MTPYETIDRLLSKDGFESGIISIKCDSDTKLSLLREDDCYILSFFDKLPAVRLKTVVPINLQMLGVKFYKKHGVLLIQNFPDIPFKYSWIMENPVETFMMRTRQLTGECDILNK